MKQSVIHYVLSRLYQLGITDVFGVLGDYAFPINDAISEDQHLRWIGSSNELNAAYAADGYARLKGVAAVNTAYGVGELSALNAIAGAYAEHLPVFLLVGMPNTTTQRGHRSTGAASHRARRMRKSLLSTYILAGRNSSNRMIFSSQRPVPHRWDWHSHVCLPAPSSTTRHSGVQSAGQRQPPLEQPWLPHSDGPY